MKKNQKIDFRRDWYTAQSLSSYFGISKRTIARKRQNLNKKFPFNSLFKFKNGKFYYHFDFLEELIHEELINDIKKMKSYKNTIDCLKRVGTLEHHLALLDWNYFITIAPGYDLSQKKCFELMHKIYDKLVVASFGTKVRMYGSIEPFTHRAGYHHHIILKINANKDLLSDEISKICMYARVDIRHYDPYLAGSFYVGKDTDNHGLAWDLMGTHLKQEGLDLMLPKVS
jgi:hypothetical protein